MRNIDPALQRVWELMRQNHVDIIHQSMPSRLLQLLEELDQKERALHSGVKPGDVVRLKSGSNEMMVSALLDEHTAECTYFDGDQTLTLSVPIADLQKVQVPRDPNLPLSPD